MPLLKGRGDRPGLLGKAAADFCFGFELFRSRHFGHFTVDMMQADFVLLEAGGHAEDRATLLAGHDPAVGKAAAVEVALNLVVGLMFLAPAAQEIGMKRVRRAFGIDGQFGGAQCLRNDLPAEHPADPTALLAADEVIVALRLDLEQFDQAGNEPFGSKFSVHAGALRCD